MTPQPDADLSPQEVIHLQVEALSDNDEPHEDAGIETAFRFASPANRKSTGPLNRFRKMLKGRKYNLMIDSDSASYGKLEKDDEHASQNVTLEKNGEKAVFKFSLSLQDSGEYEGCWMTDSVLRR